MANFDAPAWQINPRSKYVDPAIRAAYKAKTLRLITLDFGRYTGYAWEVNAETTVADLLAHPHVGASYRKANSVTITAYPYDQEVRA